MAAATINGIPVYNAFVTDEETGMQRISLVDDPAVQSNFLAFDAQKKMQLYAVEDEEKRLVRGVVMRADFPIYRRDDSGEFYVVYKADTIRKMAEKYLAEGRSNLVNLMHQDGSDVDCVDMVQFFLKDTARGIDPKGFNDIADGSLFAEFHITNDTLWDAVKAGTFKGFSLEGVFELAPEKDDSFVDEILKELEGLFKKINPKNGDMNTREKIKAALEKLLIKCGSITTDKGILAWDGDGDLEAGLEVFVEDSEGNRTPAGDGDYKTEDGKTIVVAEGKVSEIKDAEAAPEGEGEGEGEPVEAAEEEAGESEGEASAEGGEIEELRKEVKDLWDTVNSILEILNGNKEEMAKMGATLSRIEKAPAAKSAHKEVIEAGAEVRTGIKGLDNLARRLGR